MELQPPCRRRGNKTFPLTLSAEGRRSSPLSRDGRGGAGKILDESVMKARVQEQGAEASALAAGLGRLSARLADGMLEVRSLGGIQLPRDNRIFASASGSERVRVT